MSVGVLLVCSPPLTQGELALDGLQAPVTIARNRWGVPDIRAESDHDAFFARGWMKGFVAEIAYSRKHRTGLVILLNGESRVLGKLGAAFWTLALTQLSAKTAHPKG